MKLFDPSSISNWIALSAAGLLVIAFIARTIINSKMAEGLLKKDTYLILKTIISKVFWIVLIIVLIAGSIGIIEIFVNNKMKEVAAQIRKSEQMLHDWSLIEDADKKSALASLKQATIEFESYENLMLYGTGLGNVGRFNEALNVYNKAIQHKTTKELLLNKGIAEQRLGQFTQAKQSFSLVYAAQSNLPNKDLFDAKAYFNMASTLLDEYQVDYSNTCLVENAMMYLKKAEDMLNPLSSLMGIVYSQKALAYEFNQEYEKSELYYIKAINTKTALAFGNEDIISLAITNNNAASLLLKTGFIEDAIKYAQDAIYIFRNAKDYGHLAYAYYNKAEAYEKLENWHLALEIYQKSLESFNLAGISTYDTKLLDKIKHVKKML